MISAHPSRPSKHPGTVLDHYKRAPRTPSKHGHGRAALLTQGIEPLQIAPLRRYPLQVVSAMKTPIREANT